MTLQEFNSRVRGDRQVSEGLYTKDIEPLYYMAGSMDKDTFCKVWEKVIAPTQMEEIKFDDHDIFGKFAEYFTQSLKTEQALKDSIKKRDAKISKLQDTMIMNGLEESTGLSTTEIIKRKIRLGIQLTPDQLQFIADHI